MNKVVTGGLESTFIPLKINYDLNLPFFSVKLLFHHFGNCASSQHFPGSMITSSIHNQNMFDYEWL